MRNPKLSLILVLIIQSAIASGQNKLVLRKGMKRATVKTGQLAGITLKGENDRFAECYDPCACASPSQGLFWMIDSISKDHLSLSRYKYQITYRYDTLALGHTPKGRHYVRVERVFTKGDDRSKDRIVYKKVFSTRVLYQRQTLCYDSIAAITLSHVNIKNCDHDFEKVSFKYFDQSNYYDYDHNNQRIKKDAAAAIVLFTLTEGIVEYGINSTISAAEAISRKKRQLHRYDLSTWHLKTR